ncbi:hypothetical protein ACF0H5_007008 [Mactra antiquata]
MGYVGFLRFIQLDSRLQCSRILRLAIGKQIFVKFLCVLCLFAFLVVIFKEGHNLLNSDAVQEQQRTGSVKCRETFNDSIEDNLMVIKQYPKGDAEKYMWKLDGNITKPEQIRDFPVIVTAFNWNYYPQSMGLFESIHKKLMNTWKYRGKVHIVVYDLGLTDRQLKMLKMKCRCEIRKFPYDEFPPHVRDIMTYAFKPILLQMALVEFGFIWWVDSSVRFQTGNIDQAVQFAKANSVLFFVIDNMGTLNSIPTLTDPQTFKFIGEDPCKFRDFSETMATSVAFHYDNISSAIVRAWALCALNKDCIAPEGSNKKRICKLRGSRDGECHRFDQSMLSILTRRLYHRTNQFPPDKSLKETFRIDRAVIEHYFESCLPVLKCLA